MINTTVCGWGARNVSYDGVQELEIVLDVTALHCPGLNKL